MDYTPNHQHGYGSNKITDDGPDAPYHKATLYGQSSGGYKIADTYPKPHSDTSYESKESDYEDDHVSKCYLLYFSG